MGKETVALNGEKSCHEFFTDTRYLLQYRRYVSKNQKGSDHDRRATHFPKNFLTHFSWLLVPQGLLLILQLVRDFLVRVLPRAVSQILIPKIEFAFVAHPRDLSDIPRKFPFAHFLPPHWLRFWFRYQWPFVASYIIGLKTKDGKRVTGAILISPPTTEQMLQDPRLARKRVYQTVKLAEKMGAQLAGLGAFTSIVTRDGQYLVGKVKIGITTGNAYSAAIAVENVTTAASLINLNLLTSTAVIVGGAGSVGSACAQILSCMVARLILIDIKKDELRKVMERLKNHSFQVEATSRIDAVKQADVVIVATNNPYTIISAEHLKPGAIVIDAAQPKNVSEQVPLERPDVLVIESAVVKTPGIDLNFNLGLGDGEALGCLSETMILTGIKWQGHYGLGKASPNQAIEIMETGRDLGFRLAYFRNSLGYITEENITRVTRARMKTHSYV